MNLFYAPDFNLDIDISKNFDSRSWSLNKQESHHAVHVLRLNINSPVEITNGKGGFFSGVISKTDSKVCQIQILSAKIIEPRPYYIRILIAPTKNSDRFEWFLEKSTEIGVDEIIPLYCQNSERKVFNQERMEKVVIASMKQSGQAYLPKIHPLENFSTFSSKNLEGTGLIAH
jgi:16S rRNA (uracil1498-N3)-methyltransferase